MTRNTGKGKHVANTDFASSEYFPLLSREVFISNNCYCAHQRSPTVWEASLASHAFEVWLDLKLLLSNTLPDPLSKGLVHSGGLSNSICTHSGWTLVFDSSTWALKATPMRSPSPAVDSRTYLPSHQGHGNRNMLTSEPGPPHPV